MSELNTNPRPQWNAEAHKRIAEARADAHCRNRAQMAAKTQEEATEKREKDFRRLLKSAGYNLKKSPANHWTREHYGVGYMVIDDRNVVVCGATQREYDATLLQVAVFMEGIGLKPGI